MLLCPKRIQMQGPVLSCLHILMLESIFNKLQRGPLTLPAVTQLALVQQRTLLEHQRAMLEEQRSLQEHQQAQLDRILAAVGGGEIVGAEDGTIMLGPAASQRRAAVATAITVKAVPNALVEYRAGLPVEEWLLKATLHPMLS